MSYLRQGYGCMTHTGTGDKYLRWERGVTVDKYQAKAGTGKKEQWNDKLDFTKKFVCKVIQITIVSVKKGLILSAFDCNSSSAPWQTVSQLSVAYLFLLLVLCLSAHVLGKRSSMILKQSDWQLNVGSFSGKGDPADKEKLLQHYNAATKPLSSLTLSVSGRLEQIGVLGSKHTVP